MLCKAANTSRARWREICANSRQLDTAAQTEQSLRFRVRVIADVIGDFPRLPQPVKVIGDIAH